MRHPKQRGATLVEAALVLLMLITLVFAAFDFGRAYNVYQVMTNAAREGARYAVAPAPGTSTLPTSDAVKTRVQTFLDSAAVKSANVVVTSDITQHLSGLNVDVKYTKVGITTPYNSFFVPGLNVTLKTEAMMRNETN